MAEKKLAVIFQMTFSNAFSSMKMCKLWLRIHSRLFQRVQSTMFLHWLRYWLGVIKATSHYLNQCWNIVYWCIYASLCLNELTHWPLEDVVTISKPTLRIKFMSTCEIAVSWMTSQIARFMGPKWGPPGASRTKVGPMLAPWTLLSGIEHLRC